MNAIIDLFRKKRVNLQRKFITHLHNVAQILPKPLFQGNRLHVKHVANILMEAAVRLRNLPNLNPATTAISRQITICGDLHGNLDDLLVVFYKVQLKL